MAGDAVPIVATLLDRNGAIPGAEFFGVPGVIPVIIQKPGGADILFLWDDGQNNDGGANDGVYGNLYTKTTFGGTYNVRMVAFLEDPMAPGQFLTREWNGSLWVNGPSIDDLDKDGMPDPWERRCKLDTSRDDRAEDPDHDGLANIDEFDLGTLPCRADTDRGGERDGSEVNGGRNPLYPPDDLVRPLGHINIAALNQLVRVQWTHPISYTNMIGYFSIDPEVLGDPEPMGDTGIFTYTNVINDQTVYVTLAGENGTAGGDYSETEAVTPKADPDAPSGAMLINNGESLTGSKSVTLFISSSDTPLEGAAQSANAHMGGPLALQFNEVSGNIEMRISNSPSFAGAVWETLAPEKPWTLASGPSGVYTVFIQFRDGALNQSFVVNDTIEYLTSLQVYLPMLAK